MNNLKRIVDYLITLASGLNLSAANVTTATVAISTVGTAVYYVATKSNTPAQGSEESDLSSTIPTEEQNKLSKTSKRKKEYDYSRLVNRDRQKREQNLKSPSASNPSDSYVPSNNNYNFPNSNPLPSESPYSPEDNYSSGGYAPTTGGYTGSGNNESEEPNRIDQSSRSKSEESSQSSSGSSYIPPQKEDSSNSGGSSHVETATYFNSTPASTLVAGVCGEIPVSYVDVNKLSLASENNESVVIKHTSQGKFYSDENCSKEITSSLSTTAGAKTFSLYYKNTKTETVNFSLTTTRNFIPELKLSFKVISAEVVSLTLSGDTDLRTASCVGPFTVKQFDVYSNLATSNKLLNYTVSGSGSAMIYSDADCTQSASGFSTNDQDESFNFYMKNSKAEDLTLIVDDAGSIQSASLAVHFGPSKLALGVSTPLRSGDCSPVTLTLKDDLGNTAAALSAKEINLSEASSWKFYPVGDNTCSQSEITKVSFAKGDSVKTLYFKPTGHGTSTLTAVDASSYLTSVTATTSISPRSLVWSHAPATSAATCLSVKVNTYDFENVLAPVLANTTINVSASSGTAKYYDLADTTCSGTQITSVVIPSGQNEINFRIKDSVAETITLTAADNANVLISGTSSLVVGPNKLSVTGLAVVRSSDCNSYVVSPQDALGNPTTATQNYTLNLTDGTATGLFYADSDTTCSGAVITSINLLNGGSNVNFRYKDDKAETVSLNIDDASATLTSISKSVVVGPKNLDLSGTTQILSGNCVNFAIKFKDVLGNFANTSVTHTLNLADSSAEGVFYSDSACSTSITSKAVAVGVGSVSIYYKNTKQQTPTLSVSASSGELTSASLNIDVGPYKLVVAGNTETRAGDCESFTLTTKDVLNNVGPVQANTLVNLTDGAAAGSFYDSTDTTCSGAAITSVSIASGTSTASYRYKDNKGEAASLLSSDGVGTGLQDATQSLNVGPRKIVISTTTTMMSSTCAAVTVKTQDNNSTDYAVIRNTTINLDDGAATGTYYSDSGCTTSITSTALAIGASTKTVYYKNNKAELITLAAADNASWLDSGTFNTQTGPQQIILTGSTPIISGKCVGYTITTKDASGTVAAVLAATTMTLGKGASTTTTFYSGTDTTCSGAAITTVSFAIGDSSKTFYMKDMKAETISSVTASDGAGGMTDASLSVVVGPDRLAITDTTPHRSGDCDLITIKTQDAQSTDANATVALTINLSDTSATGEFYSDSGCVSIISSTSIAVGAGSKNIYYKDAVKESVTITAADAATNLTQATKVLNIGPRSIFVTGTTPILAGTCRQYTITTKDAAGTAAGVLAATTMTLGKGASTTATFYAGTDTTCSAAAITTVSFAIGDSVKSFYMKDAKAETISSVTASDGASGMVDGSLAVTVGPDRLVLTDTPPHYAGGCDPIVITSKDAQPAAASVLASTTVNLTDTTATGDFYSDSACTALITSTTIASGSTKTVYYKDTIKETVTLTAADNAASLSSGNLSINIGPSYFELTGNSPVKASDCTLYTIKTKDAAGNLSAVLASTTATLAKGTSTTATFYAAADTTCSGAAITTVSFAAGDDTKTFRMKNLKAESFTMSVDDGAGGLTLGSLNLVVGPSKLVITGRAGISWNYCRQYNIRTRDELNNDANALYSTTVDLTATGSVQFFDISDTNCVGAPITNIAFPAGVALKQVRIMDAVKELVTLTATDQSAYLAAGSLNVEIGAEKLVFTAGATPIKSAECQLYTFESQDASGVPQNVLQNVTITTDDQTGNGLVYAAADTTCSGAAITSVSMTTGTSQQQFRYKNNTAQTVQLKVDDGAGGRDIGYYSVVVGPDHLDLAGGDKISINNCTAYTVTAKDTATNTANLIYDATFDLLDGGASGDFYDTGDSTCSGATITQKTILTGANTTTIYYKDTVSELVTLSVTDQSSYLAGDTLNTEVGADRLAITGANYLRSNECGLYTLESRNASGLAQNVLADSIITLSDGTALGSFYAAGDTTCAGAAITTVTILNGTSSIQFRYKDPKAQTFTMTADDGAAGRSAGTLAMTIGPNKLSLSGAATLNSGQCSSFTINSQDSQSTNANVNVLTTVDLSDGTAAGSFYAAADTTCSGAAITQVTIASAANSTTFRYKNNTAEAVTLTAADNASYLSSATLSLSVGPGKLVLTGNSPIRSGDCTAYTITTKDINDIATNVSVATTVNLAKGASTGVFYGSSDSSCSGAAVTSVIVASGSSTQNFYFRDNKAESTVMTITDGTSSMLQDSRTIVTTARDIIITGASSALAGSCQSFTATIKDAAGNTVNQTSDLTLSLSDATAQGDFYAAADATCTGSSLTSVTVPSGSNNISFRYKNLAAENVTLTADDGAGGLNAGTKSLAVTPSKLVISGTSPQAVGACEIFTVSTRDELNTTVNATANVNINLTDGAGTGSFYAVGDTTCAGAAITSTTILNGSSSVNVRYKSDTVETVTLNADDQAGILTSGSLLLSVGSACVGSYKVEASVSGSTTTNLAAGQTFNVKVTAIDGGGSTLSCYSGTKSISWTMNGTNASSFACSESSVTPVAPSETSLNFINGVATTTSNVAKFKAVETATITVTEASMSGTSSSLTVSVGSVCKLKLKDAAGGAGSEVTSKNLDLNVNSGTTNSQMTLYAAGYDAFGNYVQDVSATWSGTGAVSPWKQTNSVTDDSVKVVGYKVGTGVLQADYSGGGGDKTASVNFTVSSTNSLAAWSSATTDLSGNSLLANNQVIKNIYWNPKTDSSNSWLSSGTQSWRAEAFSLNLRSSRADFPEKVYIVGTASALDIIDATTQVLWMRFQLGSGKALDSNFGNITSLAAINGKVFVGMQLNSSVGSVLMYDFENDTIKRMDSNGLYSFSGNIANRNSAGSWTLADASKKLIQSAVNDIKVKRSGSYDVFAVASIGGTSLLQYSGGSLSVASLASAGSVTSVAVDTSGKVYAAEENVGIHRFDLSLPASGTLTISRSYINANNVYLPVLTVNDLEVMNGTSTAQAGSNTVYIGSTWGLIVLNEHSTQASSTSRVYAAQGLGLSGFNGALLLNGVDAYGSFADAGSPMGPAQGHATTIEFWFHPHQNISSGTYSLFEKGSGNSSIKVQLDGGRVTLKYQDATSLVTSLQSTTASWSKGEWHHVAVQISATGLEMWVDGADKQTAGVDLSAETFAAQTAYVGANSSAGLLFNGMIDELRISNVARYSAASFAVPSAEFTVDANVLALYHFNSRSGANIPYADSNFQTNLVLSGAAAWAIPYLAGNENQVTAIEVKSFASNVNCLVATGATGGGLTEMLNSQNSASISISRSQLLNQIVDIFYYHGDAASDIDLGYGSSSSGMTLIRN